MRVVSLLKDERVSASNIERVPTLLMEAIVDAAHLGERHVMSLAKAALTKMAAYERALVEVEEVHSGPLH